jgi:hypothetical protein
MRIDLFCTMGEDYSDSMCSLTFVSIGEDDFQRFNEYNAELCLHDGCLRAPGSLPPAIHTRRNPARAISRLPCKVAAFLLSKTTTLAAACSRWQKPQPLLPPLPPPNPPPEVPPPPLKTTSPLPATSAQINEDPVLPPASPLPEGPPHPLENTPPPAATSAPINDELVGNLNKFTHYTDNKHLQYHNSSYRCTRRNHCTHCAHYTHCRRSTVVPTEGLVG